MKDFNELNVKNLDENIFKLFDNEWTLITAGSMDSYNTMTASWGTMGILWNKPIAVCFIRPHRFTHEFATRSPYFTLSFFNEEYRDILNFCGANSGRNCDKAASTGLIPIQTRLGNISFEQSRMFFECKKIYCDTLKPENFMYENIITRNYPKRDFHSFFIGEIEGCFIKS